MVKTFLVILSMMLVGLSMVMAQDAEPGLDHSIWDQLLQNHVSHEGWVDYAGFLDDRERLQQYLDLLSANRPILNQGNDAQAYWINAYNAFTIELILQYYPLESILDIGVKPIIPKISSPWDIRFITIGDQKYDLNNIEHSILRKKFGDPRIHFSIVCASRSCPRLRNEAYTEQNMERFLDEDTRLYINDPSRNLISSDKLGLSKIFSWYKGDFTESHTLRDYINQYSLTSVDSDAIIRFIDYDWSLNGQ